MDKIKCPNCNYTIQFDNTVEILKVKLTCPECGKITITEEIL